MLTVGLLFESVTEPLSPATPSVVPSGAANLSHMRRRRIGWSSESVDLISPSFYSGVPKRRGGGRSKTREPAHELPQFYWF
jgi:hypothetical protein